MMPPDPPWSPHSLPPPRVRIKRDGSRFRSQVWRNHNRKGDHVADPRAIPPLRDNVNSYLRDRWPLLREAHLFLPAKPGVIKGKWMDEVLSVWPD